MILLNAVGVAFPQLGAFVIGEQSIASTAAAGGRRRRMLQDQQDQQEQQMGFVALCEAIVAIVFVVFANL